MWDYDYEESDEPDAYFCNSELYSTAESIDGMDELAQEFQSVARLQRFWLNFKWKTLPVWGAALRAWHRCLSIRYRNLPNDIPF